LSLLAGRNAPALREKTNNGRSWSKKKRKKKGGKDRDVLKPTNCQWMGAQKKDQVLNNRQKREDAALASTQPGELRLTTNAAVGNRAKREGGGRHGVLGKGVSGLKLGKSAIGVRKKNCRAQEKGDRVTFAIEKKTADCVGGKDPCSAQKRNAGRSPLVKERTDSLREKRLAPGKKRKKKETWNVPKESQSAGRSLFAGKGQRPSPYGGRWELGERGGARHYVNLKGGEYHGIVHY